MHIRSASSLNAIEMWPDETTIDPLEPFGTYQNALSNYAWDAVTLQPHNRSVSVGGFASTLATDVDTITNMIDLTRTNPANADTKFYIYAAWPLLNNSQSVWESHSEDLDETLTTRKRGYYNNLIERVRQETTAEVLMVPVGEVLFELSKALANGEVPGFSHISQFYRDQLHMNYSHGRYVAGLTTYSTLFNDTPYGLTPDNYYGGENILTPEQFDVLQGIVSEVLDNHQYSGTNFPTPTTADFNLSGQVESDDLTVWSSSYGVTEPYDPNGDGVVDEADRLLWETSASTFHPADFNRDSRVNPLDFDVWEQSMGVDDGGDADGDGDTDEQDRLIWEQANVPFHPADFNLDGIVEESDLALALQFYGLDDSGDVNGDNETNGADFLAIQQVFTPHNPADFNKDYVVDEEDLQQWEATVGWQETTDIDGDGIAAGNEFLAWQQELGKIWPVGAGGGNVSNVPEPSGLILGFSLALGIGLTRPRDKHVRRN
ncbi:DUF4886 domain-containing protein [Adhaeretor mobilis]|nr:DUF4886 domain-containing protein [Adhaeretor mobilis]